MISGWSSSERTTYQIGELAARTGLTPDTLRYYERLGLLRPPRRSSGGFRLYDQATLDRLRFIKQAQLLGLSLDDIHALISYRGQGGTKRCQRVRDLLRAKLADLEQQLAELQEFRGTLRCYVKECERRLAGPGEAECPVIETLEKQRA